MKVETYPIFQTPWIDRDLRSRIASLAQILAASLLIGVCAQITIPLPFTPVPITGQSFGVMLAGGLLGSRKGALAILFYLIEGCLGLPVWAGGASGILHLIGPTGGYRIAYIFQAYLVGVFIERQKTFSFAKTAVVLFVSNLVQMTLGVVWLSFFVGLNNVLMMGFIPFLPGAAIKTTLAAMYLKIRKS